MGKRLDQGCRGSRSLGRPLQTLLGALANLRCRGLLLGKAKTVDIAWHYEVEAALAG
jgi:hypothetical protein